MNRFSDARDWTAADLGPRLVGRSPAHAISAFLAMTTTMAFGAALIAVNFPVRSWRPADEIATTSVYAPATAPLESNGPAYASSDERDAAEPAPSVLDAASTSSAARTVAATPPRPSGAMVLGQAFLASQEDGPPPFFFVEDLAPAAPSRAPLAVRYAGDVGEGPHKATIALQKGETFVDALRRAGVRAADRNAAAAAFAERQNMRQLRAGQAFEITTAEPAQTLFQHAAASEEPRLFLLSLSYRASPQSSVLLRRDPAGSFSTEMRAQALTTRTVAVSGRIHGSLYLSAKSVGAPDEVIAQIADIFAYDVDFQREIFGGDEFEALFNVTFDERGAVVAGDEVLFARLNWKGRTKEKGYYRHASAAGARADYFDRSGASAKRLLMKTPIDGARLSSGFGTRRHPILGYAKAHKGVDFAAPTGTPIKAAGDGVVERAGPYSSFGNYVRIKHAGGYKTAYAHLSRFAKGMRAGARVRQGDIIGYVGTTGRSTGPHLHYEVLYKDNQVNPQNLKIATGVELGGKDLAAFKQARDAIDALRAPQTAQTESEDSDARTAKL